MVDPLPDLRSGDLSRGRILHQIEDGCSTRAAQPGLDVLEANRDVVAQASFSDLALGYAQVEQLVRVDRDLGALPIQLIVAIAHELGEDLARDGHQVRMGDPGSVETVAGFA